MKIARRVYREIDRVAVIAALPIFGIITAAQPVIGCIGLLALAGCWHLSDLIRKKEKEARGEKFVIVIEFNHLLLLVGLIAMSFLVMRVVLG